MKFLIMNDYVVFTRYPELKELVYIFRHEVQKAQRPAEEIILTEEYVLRLLRISKRKLCYMRASRIIPFSQPLPQSSCYYLLSDILKWINNSREESVENLRKI
jgi:hypothetical protein